MSEIEQQALPHNKNYNEASGDKSYQEWVDAKMKSKDLTEVKVGLLCWAELLAVVGDVARAEASLAASHSHSNNNKSLGSDGPNES